MVRIEFVKQFNFMLNFLHNFMYNLMHGPFLSKITHLEKNHGFCEVKLSSCIMVSSNCPQSIALS